MKKQLLLLVMILLPMVASADAVEIDGIYYNLITKVGIAEVTYGNWTPLFDHDGDGRYSGIINIPESVNYEDVNYKVTSIGEKAFENCKNLTSITIPNSVTTIGEEAFENCKGLTSITIPKSIMKIETKGFAYCSSLTSVNISDISAWCNITFSGESSNPLYEAHRLCLNGEEVKDLIIPATVTFISDYAFLGCKSLTSVTFHEDLTSIGKSAFQDCINIPSVIIPNSVTDMGSSAFRGCTGLNSVKIGSSINNLSRYDFDGCTSIKQLDIDCKAIPYLCFKDFTSIEGVTIGDGVDVIASKAFSGCSGITTINFGINVKTVAEEAFYGCSKISMVNISDLSGWCKIDFLNSTANPLFYTKKIFFNDEEVKDLIIPEGVSYIGKNAFIRCEGLTSLTLPQSVETIGEDAFKECNGLLKLNISDLKIWFSYKFNSMSNPLYYARHLYLNGEELRDLVVPDDISSISDDLFENCLSITSLTIGANVTSIGSGAFSWCENLNSVILSEGLTSIGGAAFYGCKNLPNIKLPSSLQSLGENAFLDCNKLSSITIPNKIKKIEHSTFRNCTGLIDVTIGNGVRDILSEAFNGCSRLASVSIGSGIKKIEHNAFENCPELKDYYCYAEKVPDTGKDVFKGSYIEYATLYVPSSSISDYQQAEPWNKFKEITSIPSPKYTLTYVINGEVYKTYQLEEGDAITPEPAPTKEGYTFSGWSEIPVTMPAHDVTVTGTFTINKYKLTYTVDGEEYMSYKLEYGATISPEPAPTMEGYTFSGWSEIPATMPAHDVTVTGSFTVNQYTITYIIDNDVYTTQTVDYGSTIVPPTAPEREGYDFAWGDYPETMPAYDITIYGTYTTGIESIVADPQKARIYDLNGVRQSKPQKGINIINGKKYLLK